MSQKLIVHNKDLKQLIDEGYEIEVKGGYLITHHIPYVNKSKDIKYGKLIVALNINNDTVTYQKHCSKHVVNFMGEYPCNQDGTEISAIRLSSPNTQLFDDIVMNFTFSNKPQNDYSDYYEQMVRYIEIISAPAISLDKNVTAKTFKIINNEESSIFQYTDSNTTRANIWNVNNKLSNQKIAIIGLGGTGSYVLDLVAKTPVSEIHLYDDDSFVSIMLFEHLEHLLKLFLIIHKKSKLFFRYIYQNA